MIIDKNINQTKTAIFSFGRLNPPTIGHLKLVEKIKSFQGDHYLFLSHTKNTKTDPLDFETKLKFSKQFFNDINIGHMSVKTPVQAIQYLESLNYKNIVFVVGSDRVDSFNLLVNTYNGKPDKNGKIPFNFDSIRVESAGNRDPDSDDISGVSASKMRLAALAGDISTFSQGVPSKELTKSLYHTVRKEMKVSDDNYINI